MVTLDRIRLTGLLPESPAHAGLSHYEGAAMWVAEHTVETTATPEAIWRLWADVPAWAEWNGDIERIELVGPFETGSKIVMTPKGEDPVELVLRDVVEPERFVDEADGGDFVVTTHHRAERVDDERVRITYRMEIT